VRYGCLSGYLDRKVEDHERQSHSAESPDLIGSTVWDEGLS